MGKIKNKHRLKQRDIRHLIDEIHQTLDNTIHPSFETAETGKIEHYDLVFLDGIAALFRKEHRLYFTLHGIMNLHPKQKQVIVDMGAVKFVTNGADVMTPGIVDADLNISVDDAVWICDETHKKALAVGKAIISGQEMKEKKKGKAIHIYHYIGDDLWKMIASL